MRAKPKDREGKRKWMQKVHPKKGALHEALGVPAGQKIPVSDLATKPGDSPLMKKRKNLARVYRKAGK